METIFGRYCSSSNIYTSECFVQMSRAQLNFILCFCGLKVGALRVTRKKDLISNSIDGSRYFKKDWCWEM